MTTLDSLTPSEKRELDVLVDSIAEAIVRTLIVEVDDPIVRRLAVARVTERFGIPTAPWAIETLEAVDRIVDYLWEPEKRDYDEQDEVGQANHIFSDLYAVNNELRKLR